ncbi:hypothetical protein E4U53_002614 [Claviceps sorghi]|nr:hypothetical protein E4U53_002614 [Claviceps sorghi]
MQRIVVEYPDARPLVLETYLDAPPAPPTAKPPEAIARPRPQKQRQKQKQKQKPKPKPKPKQKQKQKQKKDGGDDDDDNAPPMLVGIVVARPDDAHDAAQALVRVEDVGRQFQAEWAAELERDPTFGLDDD